MRTHGSWGEVVGSMRVCRIPAPPYRHIHTPSVRVNGTKTKILIFHVSQEISIAAPSMFSWFCLFSNFLFLRNPQNGDMMQWNHFYKHFLLLQF